MFDFLNKVFGRAVDIEVVDYKPTEISFKSKDPLPLGINDVYATIEGVRLKARIQVIEVGENVSSGLWLAPTEALPYLEELFTHTEKRSKPRYRRALRIRSPQLNDFQGASLDLSLEGLRLEGQGDFVPGAMVDIQMDLDDLRQTQLFILAKVCWSAPAVEDGKVVAGLEYVNFDASATDYSYYEDFLAAIAKTEKPLAEQ